MPTSAAPAQKPAAGRFTEWPAAERPREKILKRGAAALSDAELLALLVQRGIPGRHVLDWARDLLSVAGGFRKLLSMEASDFLKIKGVGPARAALLLAVPEIMRRQLREDLPGRSAVHDPQSVITYLYASLRDEPRECFKVLFLDKANRILEESDLFRGTVDQTAVHVREILKAALERHATGIVLVHNHPSGRAEPSVEDRVMTAKIQAACNAVGISVLDHLIIGDNCHFSFREQRLL